MTAGNAKDGVEAPLPHRNKYSLMDVDTDSGFLSLLTDEGDTKEDVQLSRAAAEDNDMPPGLLLCFC